MKRVWHRTHVRFGKSTVKSFNDGYKKEVVLQPDDIFYIDVGPVWDGIEGDAGRTFVVGNDPKKLKIARDVEILFSEVREHWLQTHAKGTALLSHAQKLTEKMGYILHPSYVQGHRLSEFPHYLLYSKDSLYNFDATPSSARWVLEFQICDPQMQYGAFYEDLLV